MAIPRSLPVRLAVLSALGLACASDAETLDPPLSPCGKNERVADGRCVPCPSGERNAANDDPSGPDTTCAAEALCEEDQRVRSGACVPCPAGLSNAPGDDPGGMDTLCDLAFLCLRNQRVEGGTCVACAAGEVNAPGDDPRGPDTRCDPPAACRPNQRVQGRRCVPCPRGLTNAPGDAPTGPDTFCDPPEGRCTRNERVVQEACVPCALDQINAAGDDPGGPDTDCEGPILFPSPYRSRSDSPFDGQPFSSYFYLEDFEDRALNSPGLSVNGGLLSSNFGPNYTDSVDLDDGLLDGRCGEGCEGWWHQSALVLSFEPAELGLLPTHVGIVWTDGVGSVTFEAFASDGTRVARIVRSGFADDTFESATAEDRFFGIIHLEGIARIRIGNRSPMEVDHIQYGL